MSPHRTQINIAQGKGRFSTDPTHNWDDMTALETGGQGGAGGGDDEYYYYSDGASSFVTYDSRAYSDDRKTEHMTRHGTTKKAPNRAAGLYRMLESFPFVPPPQLSGCILFAPPTPDERAIFLHTYLPCNNTCSVTGGGITYWGEGTNGKFSVLF